MILPDRPDYHDLPTRLSRAISLWLHPLIVPTLAVLLLLSGRTILHGISWQAKGFLVGIVALNTLVIPALSIALLRTLRLIPDLSLQQPRHRLLPMLIVGLGYCSCLWMLSDVTPAFLLRRFVLAAGGCLLLGAVVTPLWKISLHMISAGGLLAMLFLINFSGFAQFPYTLLLFVVLAGALGSARLQLGSHTLAQVAAGFFGGLFTAHFVLMYA